MLGMLGHEPARQVRGPVVVAFEVGNAAVDVVMPADAMLERVR